MIDYRDILIYSNKLTKLCVQMRPNYFVLVLLPSRQINRVARPTVCNYERCVFVTLFFGWAIRLHRLQNITVEKIIKKERLKRFNRFKDRNMHWDSIYRYISIGAWGNCQFEILIISIYAYFKKLHLIEGQTSLYYLTQYCLFRSGMLLLSM